MIKCHAPPEEAVDKMLLYFTTMNLWWACLWVRGRKLEGFLHELTEEFNAHSVFIVQRI